MSAIITPFVQPDTHIAVFSVDRETAHYLTINKRFIITPLPRNQRVSTPDGLTDFSFSLVDNAIMQPFFEHPAINACLGGKPALVAWIERNFGECQSTDRSACTNQLTVFEYKDSAVRLCWHHDNQAHMQSKEKLADVLRRNQANWILTTITTELQLPADRDISMTELAFWAIRRGLRDYLPEEAGRIALALPDEQIPSGVQRESDITWSLSNSQIINATADSISMLTVNEDSGLLYMKRPKTLLGKSDPYRRFIASRPCCGCNGMDSVPFLFTAPGIDPHDRWLVPFCRNCLPAVESDRRAWERETGIRLYIVANQLFDFAIARGVVVFS